MIVVLDDSVVGSEDEQVSETEDLEKQGSDECDCDHLDDIEATGDVLYHFDNKIASETKHVY